MAMDDKNKYNNALKKLQEALAPKNGCEISGLTRGCIEEIFPELKESEDERIRKELIRYFKGMNFVTQEGAEKVTRWIAWLEKQEKETSWKPSKEEMDVLYGLAYITNQYDEHKEEVITRLYQDLKREFFNGSSYENMFSTNTSTEDDVRRRSTIQVLEYARSLDTYNQYGKADIDKNIAWLEKQGNKPQGKSAFEAIKEEKADNANKSVLDFKASDYYVSKVDGKIHNVHNFNEPKFKVGNWYQCIKDFFGKGVTFDKNTAYYCAKEGCLQDEYGCHIAIDKNLYDNFKLWTIEDAKDGDILASNYGKPFIYNGNHNSRHVGAYCGISTENRFNAATEKCRWTANVNIRPATKDQRDILMNAMNDDGYEFDFDKKELKKIICLSAKHNSQPIRPTDE